MTARIVLMLGFAYAASWWSYQRFYAPFGIAPQDVGLTPSGGLSDIIGAIVRLGLWLALALIVLGLLPMVAIAAAGYTIESGAISWPSPTRGSRWLKGLPRSAWGWFRRLRAKRSSAPPSGSARGWRASATGLRTRFTAGPWRAWIASLISLVAGGAAFAAYVWLTGWPFAGAAAAVGVASAFAWAYFWHHPRPAGAVKSASGFRDFTEKREKWALKIFDVFALVAIVGLLLVDLPEDAAGVGTCAVGEGRFAVRGIGAPVSFVHLTLLDVYAQPAVISWVGSPPADAPQHSFEAVFLGAANGWAAVYRKTAPPSVLRLPSNDILISIDPRTATCDQAH